MNEYEREAYNLLHPLFARSILNGETVDMCNLIAARCGWKPLFRGEKMTVHYGGKEYEITRTK